MSEISKNNLINSYKDAENIRLYYKVMQTRREISFGAWKIAKMLKVWGRRGTINQWINGYKKPKSIKGIENLEKLGLIPFIVTSTESFKLFVRIFGFRLSDGCIYEKRRSNSYTFALYFGILEDAEWICEDINRVWSINVKPNKFKGSEGYVVYLPSYLAKLYVLMGSPIGAKTLNLFDLPNWLLNLSNELKLEFIDGLFAGDGDAPRLKDGINSAESLSISFNSEKKLVELFCSKFMRKLKNMLNSLNIKTSEPKIEWNTPVISKDGKITYSVTLRILTQKENITKFLENINYRYCSRASKQRDFVLKGLRGENIKEDLFLFFESNGEIPPAKNICVLMDKELQKKLIEEAASYFKNGQGKYTKLAEFLYKKLNKFFKIKFDSIRDNYIFDWKYGRRFIPLFYLRELSFLSNIKLKSILPSVEKVRLFKNRNKFAYAVDKVFL